MEINGRTVALRLPANIQLPEALTRRLADLAAADGEPAVMYARISQDRTGAGLGVERQLEDLCDLAKRLGVRLVGVYVDNDLSAYSGKTRPDYEAMLADLDTDLARIVLAWHTDRLHRSPLELERYIGVCELRNLPTYTVKAGELDLTTATGRMTARITGAVARHESEQKGERLRRQRQQAQAEGRWHGGRRPFGFEPDGNAHRPTEAALIKDATERILAGESVRSIVAEWNDSGVTTATGTKWDPGKVRNVLLRPRNAGLVGNGDRIVGPAVWEPIVQRETWEALRALLTDPSRLTHKGVSRKLVGSFLYHCDCGLKVKSAGHGPSGQGRYACPANHMTKAAEPVDKLVLKLTARILNKERARLVAPAENLAPLREKLAVLRARAQEIASMFGDPSSDMDAEQFKIANERVKREIKAVEQEIGRRSAGSVLAGVADAPDPAAAFGALSIDRQRAIIDALMTVTLRRGGAGRKPGGAYFDPKSVVITPKKR